MYVAIENKRLPLKFEKLEWLERKLKSLAPSYQLVIEKRLFYLRYMEEYQFALIRWMQDPSTWERKRHLVLETTDLEQMESALFMLINVEEENKRS